MASPAKRRAENVAGEFYVDTTCIDCDTCRWMAPETFHREDGMSAVHTQPQDPLWRRRALRALVACPTASIGTTQKAPDLAEVAAEFPVAAGEQVYHCGYHSRDSFGAASWFFRGKKGNVLVDSPRYGAPLVKRLEEMGGVDWMLLTHRDDIADHQNFHDHFGCRRVIHEADATIDAEVVLEGMGPTEVFPELTAIPVPGHTEGSVVYHHGSSLFTGDHLCWNPRADRLHAFRGACWYDWGTQIASMERLRDWHFRAVWPGHGPPARLGDQAMHEALENCIAWMKTV